MKGFHIIFSYIVISMLATGLLISCRNNKRGSGALEVQERDTSINLQNAYSNLFFDSTAMESFILEKALGDSSADKLRNFYNGRNYQFAWFDKKGLAEYASTFLSMQNQYIQYSGDSSLYDAKLQMLTDSIALDSTIRLPLSVRLETELELTRHFFNYSEKAYTANDSINTQDLDWYIPRKKINAPAFLDSLVANKGKNLSDYEPVNRQYNLLKNYLLRYYEVQKAGNWQAVEADKSVYRPGDSSEAIKTIKRKLLITGDLKEADSLPVFNEALRQGIISFQQRYGLQEDGIIGPSLLRELNRPIQQRIRQILLNMERVRWVPAQPTSDYLLVNIPEFRLHVYEAGSYAWSMNVVVGSTAHNTVIFSGLIKHVVFSPYWNVPPGIMKNEILPGIKRDPSYLARHNMEWNNGTVRQKPGINNSLGLVKFLFPNSYNIYLHDSPAKSLFNESRRAFSHGCIRLASPKKLAEFLLRKDSSWTSEKITSMMNGGKERYVNIKESVPVFIGYFTAWVDQQGRINFRDDIYGHDKKLEEKLFRR